MIRRGVPPAATRIRLMTASAVLVPFSVFIAFAPSAFTAVLIAALAAFGHLSWQTSLSTLLVDLYPRALVGTVFGLVAAGSGLGGILSTNAVSHIIASHSYTPVFLAMGVLHPLGWLLVRRIGRPLI
jgi:ACS family hexuronate transporter-like MFS transporter